MSGSDGKGRVSRTAEALPVSHREVLDALARVIYPGLTRDIVAFGMVKDLEVDRGHVRFVLDLPTPSETVKDRIMEEIEAALRRVPGIVDADVKILLPEPEATQGTDPFAHRRPIPGVGTTIVLACPECHHEIRVFGDPQGPRLAEALQIPFLGAIPLDPSIRQAGDTGRPLFPANAEQPQARHFRDLARQVLAGLM